MDRRVVTIIRMHIVHFRMKTLAIARWGRFVFSSATSPCHAATLHISHGERIPSQGDFPTCQFVYFIRALREDFQLDLRGHLFWLSADAAPDTLPHSILP